MDIIELIKAIMEIKGVTISELGRRLPGDDKTRRKDVSEILNRRREPRKLFLEDIAQALGMEWDLIDGIKKNKNMINIETINSATHQYKLYTFYQYGKLGNVTVPVPGYLVFLEAYDKNDLDHPIAANFQVDSNGIPVRYKNVKEAIIEVKKMIG